MKWFAALMNTETSCDTNTVIGVEKSYPLFFYSSYVDVVVRLIDLSSKFRNLYFASLGSYVIHYILSLHKSVEVKLAFQTLTEISVSV